MMFQVHWLQRAIDSLTQAYLAATDQGQASTVTSAMAEVDRLLETSPRIAGESRSGNVRILIVTPITVEYEVFAEANTVVAFDARYTGG